MESVRRLRLFYVIVAVSDVTVLVLHIWDTLLSFLCLAMVYYAVWLGWDICPDFGLISVNVAEL